MLEKASLQKEWREYKDVWERGREYKCRLWCMWSVFVCVFGKLLCQLDRARVCSNSQEMLNVKRKRRRGHLSHCSPYDTLITRAEIICVNRVFDFPCDWILLPEREGLILTFPLGLFLRFSPSSKIPFSDKNVNFNDTRHTIRFNASTEAN